MSVAYPAINTAGIITQLPYVEADQWITPVTSMENGAAYTNVFSDRLRTFTLNYPSIIQAEVDVLQAFFDEMRGRTGEFTFKDDDGTTWNHCRFDMDRFEARYEQPGQCSVTVIISAEAN